MFYYFKGLKEENRGQETVYNLHTGKVSGTYKQNHEQNNNHMNLKSIFNFQGSEQKKCAVYIIVLTPDLKRRAKRRKHSGSARY